MTVTIGEFEKKYSPLFNEFKEAFNPMNCFTLCSDRYYLTLDEERMPDYIAQAIKRDYLKDIKEIVVENSISLTVTFTYQDGSEDEFESSPFLTKQDKNNACRLIEWMLNLKYLNDNG